MKNYEKSMIEDHFKILINMETIAQIDVLKHSMPDLLDLILEDLIIPSFYIILFTSYHFNWPGRHIFYKAKPHYIQYLSLSRVKLTTVLKSCCSTAEPDFQCSQ